MWISVPNYNPAFNKIISLKEIPIFSGVFPGVYAAYSNKQQKT